MNMHCILYAPYLLKVFESAVEAWDWLCNIVYWYLLNMLWYCINCKALLPVRILKINMNEYVTYNPYFCMSWFTPKLGNSLSMSIKINRDYPTDVHMWVRTLSINMYLSLLIASICFISAQKISTKIYIYYVCIGIRICCLWSCVCLPTYF